MKKTIEISKRNIKLTIIVVFGLVLLGYIILEEKYSLETISFGSEDEFNESMNQAEKTIELEDTDEVDSKYLHFSKKNITYSMKGIENEKRRQRMYDAIAEIEKSVGEIEFIEIQNYHDADIKINFPKMNNLEVVGEARPTYDSRGNIIGGEITMINVANDCNYHGAETHELLHIFGFDHNQKTIMDMYADRCYPLNSEKSVKYVEHLQFIYSSGERGKEHPEIPMYLLEYSCPIGYYPALNENTCCPEQNMFVDDEGYCN